MGLVRNILHNTGVETEAGQTDLHNTHFQNPLELEHNALHNTDENDLGCEQSLHSIPATIKHINIYAIQMHCPYKFCTPQGN